VAVYFPDLSPYSYGSRNRGPVPGVLNVGWLERGHVFPTGAVTAALLTKIEYLAVHLAVNTMRGWHACEFCPPNRPAPLRVDTAHGAAHLGHAEIWVPGENDIVYAAPSLVLHYVTQHQYQPPIEFLSALDRFDIDSGWDAKAECDRRLRMRC
jgi:hypothetical protein